MDIAHKSEFYRQLRAAGKAEDTIVGLEKMINAYNNGEIEMGPLFEEYCDQHYLWKFISLKVMMKEEVKINDKPACKINKRA